MKVITARDKSYNLRPSFNKNSYFKSYFLICDFRGFFTDVYYSFSKCTFSECDFGASLWHDTKFSNCIFIKCNFSPATFVRCEFRNCKWLSVDFSGNDTILQETVVTEPENLIKNIFETPSEIIKKRNIDCNFDKEKYLSRLSETSRYILINHQNIGKESDYYSALKQYHISYMQWQRQICLSKISIKKHSFYAWLSLSKNIFEQIAVRTAGFVTNWGESIARPILIGIMLLMIFSAAHFFSGADQQYISSLFRSFNIFSLAGYTLYKEQCDPLQKAITIANLCIAILWYSIFLSAIVNRVSKAR
ncbi:pentapeptide repeat-containing protein [Shinella sp. H4-D48]|uniref:pentapeptide repeat-containing protein n=1 Tax=Shinella sp. H4-D48 TaxID=2925841 RepID=UPI00352BD8DE